MNDLTPVNARSAVPILLAGFAQPVLAVQSSTAQAPAMSGLLPPLDQLALEIKALRQQALSTQASIEQLQTEQPAGPAWAVPSELSLVVTPGAALLGVGVLILGMLYWWASRRRSQTSSIGMRPEFVDSYCPPQAHHDESSLSKQEEMRISVATLPEPAPPLAQFQISPSSTPGESASEVGDNQDAPRRSSSSVDPAGSAASRVLVAQDAALEFDHEAAADEVERVLKSLASKRAARSRRPQEAHLPNAEPGPIAVDFVAVNPESERQFPGDQGGTRQTAAQGKHEGGQSMESGINLEALAREGEGSGSGLVGTESLLEFQIGPMPDQADLMPIEPITGPAEELGLEPEHDVQLSLAQELEALGLLLGARELATEVLKSGDGSIRSQAQALLRQIEEQEMAQPTSDYQPL